MVVEASSIRRERHRAARHRCVGRVRLQRAVLVLALAVLGSGLRAGEARAQESLVIQAGAGLGKLWGTPEDLPKESRVSARAEAALVWPLSPSASLQVGAGYVRESGTEIGGGLDYTLTVDFVQVPVLARFGFGGAEARFAPHALIGPTVGVALTCEIRQETTQPGGSQLEILGCDGEGGALELGALAALGLDTRLSDATSLALELIHARVLTPVDARRLQSWSLVAGLRLDL